LVRRSVKLVLDALAAAIGISVAALLLRRQERPGLSGWAQISGRNAILISRRGG
jgi:hypothetical protein